MKRFVSFALACVLSVCCCFPASAQVIEPDSTMSSPTLCSYGCTPYPGDNSGEVDFEFRILTTGIASRVGISYMRIYTGGGTYVTTVWGTTSNGLIGSGLGHCGIYTFTGTPGLSYYAEVVFTATINGVTDSKPYTTVAEWAQW